MEKPSEQAKSRYGFSRSVIGIATPYMERFVFRTPWFEVRLHHILRSDDERALHDHPFGFCSFLLTGGYTEVRPLSCASDEQDPTMRPLYVQDACHGPFQQVKHARFSVVRRKASDAHRLILSAPVWTFVIAGPRTREWGFYVPRRGWVGHDEYIREFGDV